MLINCDIQDYTIYASGSIAIESQAPVTLFKLCLPSDVIIPELIVTSFFGFVSSVEAFNFDVLLFCLLQNKGTLSFTFLYAILSCRVTVALVDCLVQIFSFLPQFVQNCVSTLLI